MVLLLQILGGFRRGIEIARSISPVKDAAARREETVRVLLQLSNLDRLGDYLC